MTPAQKLANRELKKLGCEVVDEYRGVVSFRMPSGSLWRCPPSVPVRYVREVLDNARAQAGTGIRHGDIDRFTEIYDYPELSFGSVTMTAHAKQRITLMLEQNDMLTVGDIGAAFEPEHVYALPSGSRAYARGDVALIVAFDHGYPELVTVNWTTRKLWDLFPRPGKEK